MTSAACSTFFGLAAIFAGRLASAFLRLPSLQNSLKSIAPLLSASADRHSFCASASDVARPVALRAAVNSSCESEPLPFLSASSNAAHSDDSTVQPLGLAALPRAERCGDAGRPARPPCRR